MAGIKQIHKKSRQIDLDSLFLGTQDEWLLKTLDTHLSSTQFSQRPEVFYPSTLGNPCDRFLYLAYRGLLIDSPLNSNTRRIFDNGNYLEDRMDSYFKAIGIVIDRERSVSLDFPPISGRCDFILSHDIYDQIILELKSINDRGFKALKQFPKAEHELQLQIYLNLLPAQWGTVLYENKNDQKLKAFLIQQNPKVFEQILKRCRKIIDMLEMPKTCRGNKWCPCKGVV
jgi:hypothetical protein